MGQEQWSVRGGCMAVGVFRGVKELVKGQCF